MVIKLTKSPKGTIDESCQRYAEFMPLQFDIWERIRIVPMLLDVPMLRRNKFRNPQFMDARQATIRIEMFQDRWLIASIPDFQLRSISISSRDG